MVRKSGKAYTSEEKSIAPVFVVGMNGSGTSMTVLSLGRHSRLYAFPGESQIVPRFVRKSESYSDLSDDRIYLRLWNDVRRAYAFRRYNDDEPVPLPQDWTDHERSLAGVIDGVFRFFAAREQKSRWCEKTPMNALHIEALAREFPNASFIHLIRDGRDSALSLKRRMNYVPELTIWRWKRVVREARRQGELVGDRYLEVRYEDLTSDPTYWFRRICEFIGVEFQEAVVAPPPDYETGPGDPNYHIVKRGHIVNDGLRWPKQLTRDAVASLERIGGGLLSELGYEVVTMAGDINPPFYSRARWALRGYGGEAVRSAKRLLIDHNKPLNRRIGSLLGRGWTQVRWWVTNRTSTDPRLPKVDQE